LDSLGNNPLLNRVALDLSSCDLGNVEENATFLHLALPRLACVSTLNIGDNDFSDDQLANIISAVASNARTLTTLRLDGNLSKSKTVERSLLSLKSLFLNAVSSLTTLSLRNMRLKGEMLAVLPALGECHSLLRIDLTGNHMGDAGARCLASVLNYNDNLRHIDLDDNGISAVGLRELAAALAVNTSVKQLPLPLQDIMAAGAKAPEETAAAVQALQTALCKNHTPSRHIATQHGAASDGDGAAALQSMQMLDTLVEQVNSTAPREGEDSARVARALRRVQDCTDVARSLARLEAELIHAQQETIDRRLQSFASGLTDMLGETLKSSVSDLLQMVEVETGLPPEELWQPQIGQYHVMCQELIDQVILNSAHRSIANGAAQQVLTASSMAVTHVINTTADELQAILTARSAKGDVVPDLPRIKTTATVSATAEKPHRDSVLANMKQLTLSRPADPDDMPFEAAVSFEEAPAEAGAASNQPGLTHITKERPRNAVGLWSKKCAKRLKNGVAWLLFFFDICSVIPDL
jgi:hypothetical protein